MSKQTDSADYIDVLRNDGIVLVMNVFVQLADSHSYMIAAGAMLFARDSDEVRIVFKDVGLGPAEGAERNDRGAAIVHVPCPSLAIPQVCVSSATPSDRLRVVVDEERVAKLVVDRFMAMGLQHFAFVGPAGWEATRIRRQCFSASLGQCGFDSRYIKLKWPALTIQKDLQVDLRALPKPCGIMAANDACGEILLAHCRDAGLRVPGEVNVIGVDNMPDQENADPILSSVDVPFFQMGYHATRLCVRILEGKPVTSMKLRPTGLVLRESVMSLGAEMNTAAAIAHFIRTNLAEPIEMEDLVRRSNLSRRRLEQLFRNAYDTSPMSYLRHRRLDYAKRLLCTGTDSLGDIAKMAGYRDVNHLCRVFREGLQTTPLTYRKRRLRDNNHA